MRLTDRNSHNIVTRLMPLALIVAGVIGLPSALPLMAEAKAVYKDIYLTEERVCKACTWKWAENGKVMLINRLGQATVVKPKEILGIDTHPIIRKLTLKSLHGIGKPGPDIVPAAFEEANDIMCKYCDDAGED